MYRRLNITLSDDVLARADAFAQRERYTRSGLIAAALNAFLKRDPRVFDVEGRPGSYTRESVGLNPAIRPRVPAIIEACRRRGITYAGLLGEATRPDLAVRPSELEILVRFAPGQNLFQHRAALGTEIEIISEIPVRIIDADTVTDEQRETDQRTLVVLYDVEMVPNVDEAPDAGGSDD